MIEPTNKEIILTARTMAAGTPNETEYYLLWKSRYDVEAELGLRSPGAQHMVNRAVSVVLEEMAAEALQFTVDEYSDRDAGINFALTECAMNLRKRAKEFRGETE